MRDADLLVALKERDALHDLVDRLRPLVYADGGCERCGHTDEEKSAIADLVLRWWDEQEIARPGDASGAAAEKGVG